MAQVRLTVADRARQLDLEAASLRASIAALGVDLSAAEGHGDDVAAGIMARDLRALVARLAGLEAALSRRGFGVLSPLSLQLSLGV